MVQDNAATLEAESWILCERCGDLIQGRDGHDLMLKLGVHRHQRHDSSLPDTHISLARMPQVGRTDTHQLTVAHPDGRRHSFAGTLKECKAEAERLAGLWGKKATADIIKRV